MTKPAYYTFSLDEDRYELTDLYRVKGLLEAYLWTSAFKYLWRYQDKHQDIHGIINDLEKARTCIDMLIAELKNKEQ